MKWLISLFTRVFALVGLSLASRSAGKQKAKRQAVDENVKRTRRAKKVRKKARTARDRRRRAGKRVPRKYQRD